MESPERSPPTLDEYGEPSPLRVSFCSRMVSEEEYEQQTSEHTRKALEELFQTMDTDPAAYRRVMQRRKQEEMENDGLISFLKAKALSFWGSHDAFAVSEEDGKCKMNAMKREMSTVFQYAEGMREHNGRKRSARLAEKKQPLAVKAVKAAHRHSKKADAENRPPSHETRSHVEATPAAVSTADERCGKARPQDIPPPPPLPSILVLPSNSLRPRPKLKRKSPVASNRDLIRLAERPSPPLESFAGGRRVLRSAAASENAPPHRPLASRASIAFGAEIVDGRKHLRRTADTRSLDGGAPAKRGKTPAVHAGSPASLFNAELLNKFRNAHLQSPSPTHSNASFNDSVDSSGWLSPEVMRSNPAALKKALSLEK